MKQTQRLHARSRNLCKEEQKTYCVPETSTGVTTGTHTKLPHPNPSPNQGTTQRGLTVLGSMMTINHNSYTDRCDCGAVGAHVLLSGMSSVPDSKLTAVNCCILI